MRTIGRFILGGVIGFVILTLILVLFNLGKLHAEPIKGQGVAVPTKPPAKPFVSKPMTYKCQAVGPRGHCP